MIFVNILLLFIKNLKKYKEKIRENTTYNAKDINDQTILTYGTLYSGLFMLLSLFITFFLYPSNA